MPKARDHRITGLCGSLDSRLVKLAAFKVVDLVAIVIGHAVDFGVGNGLFFRFDSRLRLPNLEVATQVEHGEVMHQAIVVAVLTSHQLGIPSVLEVLLDLVFGTRGASQSDSGNSVCTGFALRVLFLRIGTVPIKACMLGSVLFAIRSVVSTVVIEEYTKAIKVRLFALYGFKRPNLSKICIFVLVFLSTYVFQ